MFVCNTQKNVPEMSDDNVTFSNQTRVCQLMTILSSRIFSYDKCVSVNNITLLEERHQEMDAKKGTSLIIYILFAYNLLYVIHLCFFLFVCEISGQIGVCECKEGLVQVKNRHLCLMTTKQRTFFSYVDIFVSLIFGPTNDLRTFNTQNGLCLVV